jgi:hypothetical protein
MSRTQFVEYGGDGFWAYDVSLGIFLKHLIDAAIPRAAEADGQWLAEEITSWRTIAVVGDIGLTIDLTLSSAQLDTFIALADQACTALAQREMIAEEEIMGWVILGDARLSTRGEKEIATAPIIELGRAIIELVRGTLPIAPAHTAWFFGTSAGRDTIGMNW